MTPSPDALLLLPGLLNDSRLWAHQADALRPCAPDVLVMADDELKDSVETIQVNKEVPLWKEGRLILVAKYMDGEVVGEKYRLTNVSPSEMLLVEQELYRRGVRAIAVEHHTLMQGDGTDIYIVRERKDNE